MRASARLASHVMNPIIKSRTEFRIELGFGDVAAHALGDKVFAHEGEEPRQAGLQIRKCVCRRHKRRYAPQRVFGEGFQNQVCLGGPPTVDRLLDHHDSCSDGVDGEVAIVPRTDEFDPQKDRGLSVPLKTHANGRVAFGCLGNVLGY